MTPAAEGSKSDQVRQLLASGMDAAAIAAQVGCTRALVYMVKSRSGGGGSRVARPAKQKPGPKAARIAAPAASLGGFDDMIDAIRAGERELQRYRATLQGIQQLLAEVM